jgi:ribosomal protein S12 methylthiotransferase accessory factor
VRSARAARLAEACGFRHGIAPAVELIAPTFADVAGVHNACVVQDTAGLTDASAGGFARTEEGARCAAVAEALERYAASVARFPTRARGEIAGAPLLPAAGFALFEPEQRRRRGFPWPELDPPRARYAEVFSLDDGAAIWVPQELVGLGPREGAALMPSTSTGLAADPDPARALLRGLEELLERDALAVTWLASLAGRRLSLDASHEDPVTALGGEIAAFDLTQAWNPHPVVVVCGQVPLRGRRRFALGAACRASHAEAVEKAWLEFLQGTVFAGFYPNANPALEVPDPAAVRDFPLHGVYFTLHPEAWARVPLLRGRRRHEGPARPVAHEPPAAQLEALATALRAAGIRSYYRDLTTPDVAGVGLTVVRVLSPDLSLLHGDEQAPFLGGRTRDVLWRYPDVDPAEIAFVNPLPHPLG